MSILETLLTLNRVVKLQFSTRSRSPREAKKPVFDRILQDFGLTADSDKLIEVERNEATHILTHLLHQDLAYEIERISFEEASQRALEIINLISREEAKFYTSWELVEVDGKPSFRTAGSGFTHSTFDVGILAMSDEYAGCIWVEDED